MRAPAVVEDELRELRSRINGIRERIPRQEAEVEELTSRLAELRASGEPYEETSEAAIAVSVRVEADRQALDTLDRQVRELEVELSVAKAERAVERLDDAEDQAEATARELVEWLDATPELFELVAKARDGAAAAVEAERQMWKADAARVRAMEDAGQHTEPLRGRSDGKSRAAVAQDRVRSGLRLLLDVLQAYGQGNVERLQLYETLLNQLAAGRLRRK